MRLLVILLILTVSCAPKKNYKESELDELGKKNQTIIPYGTYESEGLVGSYNIPVLFIDSNLIRMEYLDSTEERVKLLGTWKKRTVDTQFFTIAPPFSQGVFTASGIFFLDSSRRYFFRKTSDSIVTIPIQDSINIIN